MKNSCLILVVILIFLFNSCSKDKKDSSSDLIGSWINPNDYTKSVKFLDGTNATINGLDFTYDRISDSIRFIYKGVLNTYIYCLWSYHKIQIDTKTSEIKIKDLNRLCLVNGDTGFTTYSKAINPNKFIGYWVTCDNLDTIVIFKNDTLKKPHSYYFDFYNYSFTNDSLKLKYLGPDKILVSSINNKYSFKNDTLIINFSTNYYPLIKKGIRKYLKK